MKNIKYVIILLFTLCIGVNVKAEETCYLCDELGKFSYKWSSNSPSTACTQINKTKEECVGNLPTAACYVCGSSNNSTYHWGTENPNPTSCNIDKNKKQADCKGSSNSASCYYCGSDNNWSYRWTVRSPDPDNCKKVTDKSQAECKGSYQAEDYVETVSCPGIDEIPAALPGFVRNIVNLMKVAIPILIIIMGMIDFAKAVTFTGDPKDPPIKKFIRRLITGILAFFIVALVQFIFSSVKDSDTNVAGCISCFISSEDSCTHSWRGND